MKEKQNALKMKWMIRLIFIGILLLMLCVASITGYDIQISSKVVVYTAVENVPFEEMRVAGYLYKGDEAEVLGCFDNKSDFYLFLKAERGVSGYLYDFEFKAIKTWIPTQEKLKFFFTEPLASLQCLIMVPEFSSS